MLKDGKFFKVADFACHSGAQYPFQWELAWSRLIALCDTIRDVWGSPLIVVSGYRTPQYNGQLIKTDAAKGIHGVASGSQHVLGNAVDLRPSSGDLEGLHIVILQEHEKGGLPMLGGLGFYPESNWVHVDTYVAPDNHLRLWTGV